MLAVLENALHPPLIGLLFAAGCTLASACASQLSRHHPLQGPASSLDGITANTSSELLLVPELSSPASQGAQNEYFDIRAFGAVGDGKADDTVAIQAAIDAASRGGGLVLIPAGIWRCNVKVRSNVSIRGLGRSSVLKSVAGSGTSVIEGSQFSSLTGKLYEPSDIGAGDNYVQLFNLTIDGDRTTQPAGWGIRIWGRSFTWRDLVVQNCKSGGIWTEFTTHASASPEDLLESFYENIKTTNNGGNGWTYRGPHDSTIVGLVAAKNDGYGFQNQGIAHGYNGGVSGSHWNAWLNRLGAYKIDWTLPNLSDFHAAGEGTIGLDVSASAGSASFAGAKLYSTSIGAILRGVGQRLSGQVSGNTTAGIRLDGCSLCSVDISGTALQGAAIEVITEGGSNSIRAVVSTNGSGVLVMGRFLPSDILSILNGFDGSGLFQQPRQSPPTLLLLDRMRQQGGATTR